MTQPGQSTGKIGIVGMGTMGRGIARAFLATNHELILIDENRDLGNKLLSVLTSEVDKRISKGILKVESRDQALARIHLAEGFSDFSQADLIIEAVDETPKKKEWVYLNVEPCISDKCLFVSNTSSLSINELSDNLRCKDRFAGMHFFNPADILPLIEISRSNHTSDGTVARLHEYAALLGKTPIDVPDIPGFYVNRILFPMIIEAIRVHESVPYSNPEDIDTAMKKGANMPMGPLELSDLIGNDVVMSICDTLFRRTKSPCFEVPELLRQMVAQKKLGRKTGEGFRKY